MWPMPKDPEPKDPELLLLDDYRDLCAGKNVQIKELKRMLANCAYAMRKSVEYGCTDHLDCCDDGGAFWYSALEEAECHGKVTA